MQSTDPVVLSDFLQQHGVVLAEGLTDDEVSGVEGEFGFRFPPDLRMLLQYVLPVSEGFANWRHDSPSALRDRLAWPLEGMCFDIEHNAFWLKEWGPKPEDLDEAFEVARRAVADAPTLIPIYSHRYIPDEPHLVCNPIFSVYQTDIIYYGTDLADYFGNEFAPVEGWSPKAPLRTIRFWSQVQEAWISPN